MTKTKEYYWYSSTDYVPGAEYVFMNESLHIVGFSEEATLLILDLCDLRYIGYGTVGQMRGERLT